MHFSGQSIVLRVLRANRVKSVIVLDNVAGCRSCTNGASHALYSCRQNFLGEEVPDYVAFQFRNQRFCSRSAVTNDENDTLNIQPSEDESLCSTERSSEDEIAEVIHSDVKISGKGRNDRLNSYSDETSRNRNTSKLFEVISSTPQKSFASAMDKWAYEGNELGRPEISMALLHLRQRLMYSKALQFMKWLEARKILGFTERDYACRIDLISKVHGFQKAEKYIQMVPESIRGELIYRTLLACCVNAGNMTRAEELFRKMRELGVPITLFACNQMLLLYDKFEKSKISDILALMEEENIKPSLLTYKILIDCKGVSNDITGMEKLVKYMTKKGIRPDISIQIILAKHYISKDCQGKAKAVLKDMEEEMMKGNHMARRTLLHFYASMGDINEVKRVWKFIEVNARVDDYVAAIEACGKLSKMEEAEAIFHTAIPKFGMLLPRAFAALLNVYANNMLLDKGRELVKQLQHSGCWISPSTWDALVGLCVKARDVEKANLVLQNAEEVVKPLFKTYIVVMNEYAGKGDVDKAEKLLLRMRQVNDACPMKAYELLLQAYVKAETPIDGFLWRMKVDKVFPNRVITAQLEQAEHLISQEHKIRDWFGTSLSTSRRSRK